MQFLITYLSMVVFFLLVDAVMIIKVIHPLFSSNVPEILRDQVNFFAAGLFYVFYVFGVYWFGTLPGIESANVIKSFLLGAFLGLLAYSTYEITNFSTIKGWSVQMVVLDTIWGGLLGGLTASVGFYVNRMTEGWF